MDITASIMTGIVANACYSALQFSSTFLKDKVKEKILCSLKEKSLNAPPDEKLDEILDKLALLNIDEDSSVKKISKEIASNSELVSHLKNLDKIYNAGTQSVIKKVHIENSGLMHFGDINQ